MTATAAPGNKSGSLPRYSDFILRLVAYCFVLSGATGLIYEVLWVRMLGLVFGATTLAVSTVLARVNLKSEADIRSWYVCDQTQLAPAVAGAVINTDDNMHIETTVPRESFRPLMESNAAWIEKLSSR